MYSFAIALSDFTLSSHKWHYYARFGNLVKLAEIVYCRGNRNESNKNLTSNNSSIQHIKSKYHVGRIRKVGRMLGFFSLKPDLSIGYNIWWIECWIPFTQNQQLMRVEDPWNKVNFTKMIHFLKLLGSFKWHLSKWSH